MMDWLKKLFGAGEPGNQTKPETSTVKVPGDNPEKPPIPQAEIDQFTEWFRSQTRPAIAFEPAPDRAITPEGSRLGGPAWLANGEAWPQTAAGVPLELVFQLDCADCAALPGYPADTIIQFFIGRDDLFGANFDELVTGNFLIHTRQRGDEGALHNPPPLEEINGQFASDYSPFVKKEVRNRGTMVNAVPVTDTIDFGIDGVYDRVAALGEDYDIEELEDWIQSDGDNRPLRHHTGGYPAFTQADITATPAGKPFDHVLLRLTSDDILMWGDAGECVFLIRSDDLRQGNFSRVAYSWDCC